ncbi:nuclear poly(A) polymerase 3-like [Panicum miliaceum]|uniref:polynucleotide adenylyltransferase n=1 Tax=Panicum miliaceum TaxID=4540 RepID=A0A3L6SBN9_PANMI|nr:nuclear poly(A) polymerase 3-like [Panicum miliaceum]
MGPPPPPPIPPTPGMYLPGPPPPGVLLPRPIPAPLTREVIAHMDECRSRSLLKIVMDWAKRVAYEQRKQHWITSAAVLTFGSYALGAYGPESDIDVLCVGPYIASLQHHFFVVLRHMLEGRPEVSELHSIEGAKVPLMRFKFNGILVDFPYVQLPVINAAEAIHAFDPRVLENVDGASWKCLSGVCVNRQIIQLVPNMKLFGFFAGIHLAILAAYVCRRHPNASINTLLSLFFEIFVHWPWPLPVSLLDPPALCRGTDGCSLMPIMLPCIPPEFCSSSMTQSTFSKIKEELRRGYALTKDTRTTDFDWSWLFAPFPYGARYKCFLRIFLSALMAEELRDWVGWVKSRFRNLILKLESLGVYCDPDPSEQADHTINEPNVVFFWGLMYRRNIQICTSSLKEDFMKSVLNNIYGKEKCAHLDITMSIVGPPQLPKSVFDHSVYSEKLPPHMMGHQLMKQSYNAVS